MISTSIKSSTLTYKAMYLIDSILYNVFYFQALRYPKIFSSAEHFLSSLKILPSRCITKRAKPTKFFKIQYTK